jgi:amidohydrolase
MHITALLAAAHTLVNARQSWSGTLLLAFQPAEERGTGAQAMVSDGLYDPSRHAVPIPDVCIGGHVVPFRAGSLGTRPGLVATSADSMRITLHGRGGHASMPHRLIDPVVLAAHTILRLQTIVSREVDPWDTAVVTVASIQAGDAENVVVDDARIAVDVRTANSVTREKVLASVRRIVNAESIAAGAISPPTIEITRTFPLTINDASTTSRLEEVFSQHFPLGANDYNPMCEKLCGSEDFGILASAVGKPASFFLYGGTEQGLWDECEREGTTGEKVPINHSSGFAPAVWPTLRTGCDAYVLAALTWMGRR